MAQISDITTLSTSEKLQMMEQLWGSLLEDDANITSPEWHHPILKKRHDDFSSGEIEVITIEKMKSRINLKIR